LSALHAPAELVISPQTGAGVLNLRHWSARLSGGQIRGNAVFRLGEDRSFQSQVQLSAIDLQTLMRIETDASRPGTGKVSGKIALSGPDPSRVDRYRGRINLDLDDASLFTIPVFREIDRFLGSAGGGLVEDGDLVATIANRQIIVEMLTLEGRLLQLH